MNRYKTYDKSKLLSLWAIVCTTLALLMIFPTECRAGAANGVFLCIQVLIPSLFPFMVLASFVVSCGISYRMPNFIKACVRRIFDLPGETSAVIILSLLGGYPVGAKGINSLLREKLINKSQAQRMSLFCVASGPGFLVTYLGVSMLGSPQIGYIFLASQTASVLILGVLARFMLKPSDTTEELVTEHKKLSVGDAITLSVSEGIKASAGMCGLVILFGAFCEIFLSLTDNAPELLPLAALIEITNGTKVLAEGYSAVMISAACGFGGLCVHFQVFQQLSDVRVPIVKFYIFRVLQAAFSAVFTYILLKIFPQRLSTFSTINSARPQLYSSVVAFLFLLLSSVIFLISLRNSKRYQ